jgi:hypothetical protein
MSKALLKGTRLSCSFSKAVFKNLLKMEFEDNFSSKEQR